MFMHSLFVYLVGFCGMQKPFSFEEKDWKNYDYRRNLCLKMPLKNPLKRAAHKLDP